MMSSSSEEDSGTQGPSTPFSMLFRMVSDRIEMLHPVHGWMFVQIEGERLFVGASSGVGGGGGTPPASKISIEAMKSVEVKGEEGGDCPVCLEELSNKKEEEEAEVVIKEMPCRHRFHGSCIEKWLGMHGSCPVCRYRMPEEELAVACWEDAVGFLGPETYYMDTLRRHAAARRMEELQEYH